MADGRKAYSNRRAIMNTIKSARIGDTLYIYDETTEATVKRKIVPNGHGATFRDGSSEWIVDEAIVDLSKAGSAIYVWDRSGNKVKHKRCRYKKDKAGNVTRTIVRTLYKVP